MTDSQTAFPKKAILMQIGIIALVWFGYSFFGQPTEPQNNQAPQLPENNNAIKPVVAAAAKILAPIGKVTIAKKEPVSLRSSEEIYTSTCEVCHDNGIAEAPYLEDKTDWEARLANGFNALVTSAINGKGGMPPRGGADLSDAEMELVVAYMIKQTGIELVAKSAEKTPEAPNAEASSVTSTIAETTEDISNSEKVSEMIPQSTEAKFETEIKTTPEETLPEKTPEIKESQEPKKENSTESIASTKTEIDHSAGESVYQSACFACHNVSVMGSPMLGDKAAWSARLDAGIDALYTSAINGKGLMPPKGGNTNIPDEDIKAAVDYMIYKSQ